MLPEINYLETIEANLKIYESRVNSESTVSEKMKDYIKRKKSEIAGLKRIAESEVKK